MSEGIWPEHQGLDEWSDENVTHGSDTPSMAEENAPPAEPAPVQEQAAPEEPGPLPVTREEVVQELERERDDKGRFVKSDEVEAPPKPEEPEPEPDEPEPEPESEPELLLGKFRSQEDLARAYSELENRLSLQGQELGEMRALREEMQQVRQQMAQPKVPDNWDDLMVENPAAAARAALNAGDKDRYAEAREAWEEESPGAPDIYEQNMVLNYEVQQLKQQFVPQRQDMEVQATAQALQSIKQEHPDFDNFEEAIAQVMVERPLYMQALKQAVAEADAPTQRQIFDDLYNLVAGRRSDNLTQAQTEANVSAAEQQLRARQDAVVVSATGNATEPVKSAADLIADEWDKLDAPYRSGWLEP